MTEDDKYPSQLAERFQIRMPDGLRDELREAAEENNRSMNAEIVWRLMQSLGDAADGPEMKIYVPADLQKRVALAANRHGVSVNDEILNVLNELYPAPRTAAEVAREIEQMMDILNPASSVEEVQKLLSKLQSLAVHIYSGRALDVGEDAQNEVGDRYERYGEEGLKDRSRPPIGSDDL